VLKRDQCTIKKLMAAINKIKTLIIWQPYWQANWVYWINFKCIELRWLQYSV